METLVKPPPPGTYRGYTETTKHFSDRNKLLRCINLYRASYGQTPAVARVNPGQQNVGPVDILIIADPAVARDTYLLGETQASYPDADAAAVIAWLDAGTTS